VGIALKMRMAQSCAMLELIDLRRARTGNEDLGAAIEKRILDRELADLERAAEAEALNRPLIGREPVGGRVRHFKRSVSRLIRMVLVWLIASAPSAHPGLVRSLRRAIGPTREWISFSPGPASGSSLRSKH
jgi:hypothetical protein